MSEREPDWMPDDDEIKRARLNDTRTSTDRSTVTNLRALIRRAGIKAQIEALDNLWAPSRYGEKGEVVKSRLLVDSEAIRSLVRYHCAKLAESEKDSLAALRKDE